MILYLFLMETMGYKACFSHSARRDQRHIVAIGDVPDKLPAFRFAVAKIGWRNISARDKRIDDLNHGRMIDNNYVKIIIIK